MSSNKDFKDFEGTLKKTRYLLLRDDSARVPLNGFKVYSSRHMHSQAATEDWPAYVYYCGWFNNRFKVIPKATAKLAALLLNANGKIFPLEALRIIQTEAGYRSVIIRKSLGEPMVKI